MLWGRILISPPEAVSFADTRGKEVSSFEKVLVSGEGEAVSEWIWMGSSVTGFGFLGICFCRDQDMKVFFRG
jgi:hypothetical protein